MLLSISLKNWKSFEEKTTFTMEASKEQRHRDTLADFKKFRLKLLPIAAIFGSNASGKSNFVKAFSFVQRLLLEPAKGLSSPEPFSFRLDETLKSEPSEIEIQLMLGKYVYSYFLSFTNQKICEESLYQLNTSSSNLLFRRTENRLEPGPSLSKEINKDSLKLVQPFFNKNHPALSILGNAELPHVKEVFNWFKYSLRVITPDTFSISESNGDDDSSLDDFVNLDTGIKKIKYLDYNEDLPSSVKKLCDDLQEGDFLNYRDPKVGAFRIGKYADGLHIEKILTVHVNKQGKEELFSFADESDGSVRLFDLLPAMDKLKNADVPLTFVVDEFDRSLHTKLTANLISRFLNTCTPDSKKQLIFTTHDALLINQDLLRRDELWIANREADGSSTLYPMVDFKELRVDKDIRKSYLEGRMGGLPNLLATLNPKNVFKQEPVEVKTREREYFSISEISRNQRIRCQNNSETFVFTISRGFE